MADNKPYCPITHCAVAVLIKNLPEDFTGHVEVHFQKGRAMNYKAVAYMCNDSLVQLGTKVRRDRT